MGFRWILGFMWMVAFCTHRASVCQAVDVPLSSGQTVQRYRSGSVSWLGLAQAARKENWVRKTMDESQFPKHERVYVFILDGSKQCDPSPAPLSLESARKKLESAQIPVFEAEKTHSGNLFIQVCGAPTGQGYRFQIPKAYLKKAISLGFELLGEEGTSFPPGGEPTSDR